MSEKKVIFLKLVLLCLCLLPVTAEMAMGQGSIGPLQHFGAGAIVSSSGVRAGSLAYFTAYIPTYPPQPFISRFLRSDGTWEGTFSITPLPNRIANSHGNLLFFSCAVPDGFELCRSDGTLAGTFPVTQGLSLALDTGAAGSGITMSVPQRGLFFFSAGPRSESPGFGLWATDGTPEGTRLVKDVSNPRGMIAFGGRLFFIADTAQGRELWRSDGTPEGTEPVLDLYSLYEPGVEITLRAAGGALFILVDAESGAEVWRSDGTMAGTIRIVALLSRLGIHQTAGRHLFFLTRDEDGQAMWAIDGGNGHVARVLEMETVSDLALLPVGDHVAFSLEDDHGREPWWSDGTPEGTRRIEICPGPCSSFQSFSTTYGGRVVLQADDGISGAEPWVTDGTAAGTFRLGDFCPGECGGLVTEVREINGWLVLLLGDRSIRVTDGTPDSSWTVGRSSSGGGGHVFPERILFAQDSFGGMTSLPVTAPAPLPGAWLESVRVPGFRFKVQIDGQTVGKQEPTCMARTLCVSGALPGRAEVFLRVAESKWPSVVKLTTSAVDVWVVQTATGNLRHYRLNGSDPAGSNLEGIMDREGFQTGTLTSAVGEAKKPRTPQPPGKWIEAKGAPGFRVQARLTSDGESRILRKAPCITETFCLGAPGTTELIVRVTGPRPNGYFWPMMARFTPATLEVWVQQRKTGKIRYYKLNPSPAGSSELDGYFDRLGFKK